MLVDAKSPDFAIEQPRKLQPAQWLVNAGARVLRMSRSNSQAHPPLHTQSQPLFPTTLQAAVHSASGPDRINYYAPAMVRAHPQLSPPLFSPSPVAAAAATASMAAATNTFPGHTHARPSPPLMHSDTASSAAELPEASVSATEPSGNSLAEPLAPDTAARVQPQSSVRNEVLETAKLLAAGGMAGAVSKSATAPLARLTILYQVQGLQTAGTGAVAHMSQMPMREAFMQIVHKEGVRALWKGNGATMLHRLPYSAINFWAYERFTELWQRKYPQARGAPHSHRADVTRRLAAGGAAGMCACSVAYPLDLLRTRLAAQTSSTYYLGIRASLRTIVRDEGARGLYRGLGATLIQVAPSLAINYCAYETLRSYWMSYQPERIAPTVPMSLLCGSFAGLVSSTATFPLDVARRRLQLEGQRGAAAKYNRYSDVFREIVSNGGLRGLYCGIIPEYAKVIPGVAIAFCSYELMKKLLGVRVNVTNR